ncbi:DNA cytosine methyltransferase [Methylobacterium sp. Leaf91]|uniref:DNA cytosine methyltransferase n=1 Tax=Methylobacterium sp. Leaf91 TaxID=1736247 RepID=UPI0009E68216|nr:DNA cytosine methyltransferase [Methylobacterium sp. Leaf91]
MLLSLFCGAGGLDLGFEKAGYKVGLAFDKKADSVASYNHNRKPANAVALVADVKELTLDHLDQLYGKRFEPTGLIGGPPCQSFSQANRTVLESDIRHTLPLVYCDILERLNNRKPVQFFVMENVTGLCRREHADRLSAIIRRMDSIGFNVEKHILNASLYQTPQKRERLFLVGINRHLFNDQRWLPPIPTTLDQESVTVRYAIGGLPEPAYFERGADPAKFPAHPNHWCMQPKSSKFLAPGALIPGNGSKRSFKTLAWETPSITVAYGNREVHIHPNCHRRLSVYEAMLLQSFPKNYELVGSLSSQFAQVSEAVPPLLAQAVAESISRQLKHRPQKQDKHPFRPLPFLRKVVEPHISKTTRQQLRRQS